MSGTYNTQDIVSLYRKMSAAEAATTLDTGHLQPSLGLRGMNPTRYLSESLGKVLQFENGGFEGVETKTLEFILDKSKYDTLMGTAVDQRNSSGVDAVKINYEGWRLFEQPDMRNIGIPPTRLDQFNDAVVTVREFGAPFSIVDVPNWNVNPGQPILEPRISDYVLPGQAIPDTHWSDYVNPGQTILEPRASDYVLPGQTIPNTHWSDYVNPGQTILEPNKGDYILPFAGSATPSPSGPSLGDPISGDMLEPFTNGAAQDGPSILGDETGRALPYVALGAAATVWAVGPMAAAAWSTLTSAEGATAFGSALMGAGIASSSDLSRLPAGVSISNTTSTFGTGYFSFLYSSAADASMPTLMSVAKSGAIDNFSSSNLQDVWGLGQQSGLAPSQGGQVADTTVAYTPGTTTNDAVSDDLPNVTITPADTSYYDTSYSDSSYSDTSYYSDYGGDYGDWGGGWGDYGPVILDLTGAGIKITPLSSSNDYFDTMGDGRQHRTAWAGAGNGILVLDQAGNGQITQRNQVVFTDWDPTATSDMQALRDVFDTNGNGMLDAGDAQFTSFKILVTNADGTTTLKTLAEAGITSINLVADSSKVALPDGSTIDGQTTFTRTDGSTGKAATVSLMSESAGYILNRTVTPNADGSTTIDSKAFNPDGSLAQETVSNTSADGKTRTLSFDRNGDGVIDLVQTIATVTNANGSTTETLTNTTGAGVLIDRTVTTTSADGKTISIGRDRNGDGANDETEVRTTAVDGSTTIVVSELNRDGSLKGQTTSTTSADGLTRTVQSDLDGNGSLDLTQADVTVVNADGSRTKTVTETNQNGSVRDRTTTSTSSDARSKTVSSDLNGDGIIDLVQAMNIVVALNGSSTTTATVTSNNGTLIGSTVTAISADGLSQTTQTDVNGDGTVDLTTSDVTVVNADGSRLQTVSDTYANGSLRDLTTILKGADGRSRTMQTDVNGDGVLDMVETVAVNASNATIATVSTYNANGTVSSQLVNTTSADGLTVTRQADFNGDGTFERTHADATVKNADGSSTTTATDQASNGALLDKAVVTTSANGLSTTSQTDINGDNVFDVTRTDVTVVNADGSRIETIADRSTNGTLLAQSIISTSADRQTVTITRDANGDGSVDRSETIVTQANGSTVDTVSDLNPDGSLLDKAITTASATGLSITTQVDVNGDGIYDLTRTDVTTLNADGSRTETISERNADGSLRDQLVTTISATGLSTTVHSDANGDGVFELTTTSTTVLNLDGSRTQTVSNTNANGSLRNSSATTTSGNGLSVTRQVDLDGDGVFDRTSSDVVVLSSNGSKTETVTDRNANGTLRAQTVTTTSGDGRTINITRDTNGDGNKDQAETISLLANGWTTDTVSNYSSDGVLHQKFETDTSPDGNTVNVYRDLNGDGIFDQTAQSALVFNTDGSSTATTSTWSGATSTSQKVVTTSADGLTVTTTNDFDGDGFIDLTSVDVVTLHIDGSRTETVTNTANDGTLRDQTITATSADRRTINVAADVNGLGVTQLAKTIVIQADGSETATITYPNMGTDILWSSESDVRTRSANGLASSVHIHDIYNEYINTGSVTTLNADGSRTETFTNADIWGYDVTRTTDLAPWNALDLM